MSVVSCLTGMMVKKHPTLDIWCRDDGAVLLPSKGPHRKKGDWTYGCTNSHGYKIVGYNRKYYGVHRLIAEAFLDNPEGKPTVDHINRIKDDNRLVNLRFATVKEQADNRQFVIDAPDYGARKCEDYNAYRNGLYAMNEEYREKAKRRSHDYYHRKVSEGWRLTRHGWERA